MDRKPNKRRHERSMAGNRPIQLVHLNTRTYYILPADESKSGMGCIYTGDDPPEIGAVCVIREDGPERKVEVKWVMAMAQGIYRLGLQYI
jgi:hypothetical protein